MKSRLLAAVCGLLFIAFQPVQANTAPVADAGDDITLLANTGTMLDGTGSFDPDGDTILYFWQEITATQVVFTNVGSPTPNIFANTTVPATGLTANFELQVYDGEFIRRKI